MSLARPLSRTFEALEARDFRLLWLGIVASFMAMMMQQVARGYLAYELSGSGTVLGLVSLAWGLPQLVLSPFGGVAADRFSKRNLLIGSQAFMGFTTLVNAVLISLSVIEVWHLVALGLCQGAVFAFNMPARQALVYTLAGPERVANAVAVSNAGMNLTRIAGPALAGVLIGIPAMGTAGCFYLMSGAYLVALAMLFQLPPGASAPGKSRGPVLEEIMAGVRYIRGNSPLMTLLVSAFVVILVAMPYQTLIPLFALRVFTVGPEGLGLLNAVSGLGALAGSLAVAYFSASRGMRTAQIVLGTCFGLTLVLFALAPWFWLAAAAMFLVGAVGNSYLSLNSTFIMTGSEKAMHGRVMSVYLMTWGLMPVTTMPMSVLADAFGAPTTVAAAGALTALIVLALNNRALLAVAQRAPITPAGVS